MELLNQITGAIVGVLWHPWVLYGLLLTGIVFTIWSGFGQYRALTHGVRLIRGDYDTATDPGALNHFQALSAALSATVGLGNIAGVALAVELGGPGAVFWMWVVGVLGMATKMTEVILSMLYRDTSDPDNPHGGPMWVAKRALADRGPFLAGAGTVLGGLFCITLLVATTTGGNMFQAWNVAEITETYFGVPSTVSGIVLALLVGLVIIGGVRRIGRVTGTLVPLMVVIYLVSALLVLALHVDAIPGLIKLIFVSAFHPAEAAGAFAGGALGSALTIGMQRALFSSEAGVGSAPIAHSAAKTSKPVRGGIVAGLEPFIDTIVVCTITALVILSTGVWNRPAEVELEPGALVAEAVEDQADRWTLRDLPAPATGPDAATWKDGQGVFAIVHGDMRELAESDQHRLPGNIVYRDGQPWIQWGRIDAEQPPQPRDTGIYISHPGASLTAMSFDAAVPGLGKFMVTLAVWLFAISTMISWSYYGEQGVVYLVGERGVQPYRYLFCAAIIIATLGLVETATELNNLTAMGTGVMLWVNMPIIWLLGFIAMRAYRRYIRELRAGDYQPNPQRAGIWSVLRGTNVR